MTLEKNTLAVREIDTSSSVNHSHAVRSHTHAHQSSPLRIEHISSRHSPSESRAHNLSAKSHDNKRFYTTIFNLAVLIAGLGYLVDTYDFFLYNGMRVVSLTELGLSGDTLTKTGILILNCQIIGALLGSFVWGIMGDKSGRKKALLGSVLIYSLGMVANAFVHDTLSYEVVRFIIGFGVAGEVGLGATLIAETVRSSKRTYALMFFTMMGVLGVTIAGASIELLSWRNSCLIGGVFGLSLLTLRGFLFESEPFMKSVNLNRVRGSLKSLFGTPELLKRYLLCIPILGANFFVTGILLTLAPEIARATNVYEPVKANIALGIYFLAAVAGDWFGARMSEKFKNRRVVVACFILGNLALSVLFLQKLSLSAFSFYALCAGFGAFNLWALTGTILVEQFPTALRATATTSNLNLSRASMVLMNLTFLWLKPSIGVTNVLLLVGAVVYSLGMFCVWRLPETYGQSLEPENEWKHGLSSN